MPRDETNLNPHDLLCLMAAIIYGTGRYDERGMTQSGIEIAVRTAGNLMREVATQSRLHGRS